MASQSGDRKPIHAAVGRYRPVQGSVLFIFTVFSIITLVQGPDTGANPAFVMTSSLEYVWRSLILIGTLTAMAGEIIALRQPAVATTPYEVSRLALGMLLERAGLFLVSLNLGGYAVAFLLHPESDTGLRSTIIVLALAFGMLGRAGQITMDLSRMETSISDQTSGDKT